MNMNSSNSRRRFSIGYVIAAFIIVLLIQQYVGPLLARDLELPYSEFKNALKAEEITSVMISEDQITGEMKDGTAFFTVRVEDPTLIDDLESRMD